MARVQEGKKQSEIVDDVFEIASADPFKLTFPKNPHMRSVISLPQNTLSELWEGVLFMGHDVPVVEIVDEVSRQEFESLCDRVEAIEQVVFKKQIITELELDTIFKLCNAYIEKISSMDIVDKVILVDDEDVTTCWTIIDALPFDDSLREPIYEAQLEILRSMDDDVPLDFHVLNIAELPDPEKLEQIIPSDAQTIWQC